MLNIGLGFPTFYAFIFLHLMSFTITYHNIEERIKKENA